MHVTWNTHFLALVLVLFDIGNYVNIYATLQYSICPFGIGNYGNTSATICLFCIEINMNISVTIYLGKGTMRVYLLATVCMSIWDRELWKYICDYKSMCEYLCL